MAKRGYWLILLLILACGFVLAAPGVGYGGSEINSGVGYGAGTVATSSGTTIVNNNNTYQNNTYINGSSYNATYENYSNNFGQYWYNWNSSILQLAASLNSSIIGRYEKNLSFISNYSDSTYAVRNLNNLQPIIHSLLWLSIGYDVGSALIPTNAVYSKNFISVNESSVAYNWYVDKNGFMHWGDGIGSTFDTTLKRLGLGWLEFSAIDGSNNDAPIKIDLKGVNGTLGLRTANNTQSYNFTFPVQKANSSSDVLISDTLGVTHWGQPTVTVSGTLIRTLTFYSGTNYTSSANAGHVLMVCYGAGGGGGSGGGGAPLTDNIGDGGSAGAKAATYLPINGSTVFNISIGSPGLGGLGGGPSTNGGATTFADGNGNVLNCPGGQAGAQTNFAAAGISTSIQGTVATGGNLYNGVGPIGKPAIDMNVGVIGAALSGDGGETDLGGGGKGINNQGNGNNAQPGTSSGGGGGFRGVGGATTNGGNGDGGQLIAYEYT